MTDLIESQFIQSRKKAEDEKWQQSLTAELGGESGVPQQVAPEAIADPKTASTISASGVTKVGKDIYKGVKEAPGQMVGGAFDAINQAGKAIEGAGNYLRDKTIIGDIERMSGLGKVQVGLPEIAEPESTTGGLIRSASQFLTGFIPGLKATKVLKGVPVVHGAVAGAIADFSVFDPKEERVSNLINSLAPALKNPITEYLEAKPEDTEAEGRLKNTLEGLGIGGALDGILHVVRAIKGAKTVSKGKEIAPKVEPPKVSITPGIEKSYNDLKSLAQNWDQIVEKQRRGTRPREQARLEGKELGMTVDDVRSIAPGTAMNDAQTSALVDVIHGLANDTQLSATKFLQTGSQADMEGFLKNFLLLGEADPSRFGVMAEAGRSLGILNEPISGINKFINQFSEIMAEAGDVTPERLAQMIGELKTPAQTAKMAIQATRPGASKMLMEIWINSLLSGPITHAVNFTSNLATAFFAIPERALAARLHSGISSGVVKGEATQMLYGMVNGFMDALRLSGDSLWSGQPKFSMETKVENYVTKAISGESLNVGGVFGRAVDFTGEFVRLPGRFLMAADEFWKVINYRGELHAEAFRKATGEGLSGDAFSKRVNEIIANPPHKIKAFAEDFANYQTFTKELGPTGQAIQAFTSSHPLAKVIMPFTRTPTNIFKYAFERTPGLNILSQQFRADIMAGGVKRDLALGKMAMGSLVFSTIGAMSSAGLITGGGPQDKELRRMMKNELGWQPYSIKVGDQYYSYNRLEPIGMLFGVASSFTEIAGELGDIEADQLAVALSLSFAESFVSKTYVTGLSNALEAIRTPDTKGIKAAKTFAGSLVPSIVAQYTKVSDPVAREVETIIDQIKSRTPGYSKDLPVRRNLWGEPIVLQGGLGPDIISPIFTSTRKDDPVAEEILRHRVPISMPPKYIGGSKPPMSILSPEKFAHGIQLNPQEYDRFVQLAGKELKVGGLGLKDKLHRLIVSPEYQKQSDGPEGGKALLIRQHIALYREGAKLQLRKEFPELDKLIKEGFEERVLEKMPQRRAP